MHGQQGNRVLHEAAVGDQRLALALYMVLQQGAREIAWLKHVCKVEV